MDFDPKHDPTLDLPLRFPDDPVDSSPSSPPLPPVASRPQAESQRPSDGQPTGAQSPSTPADAQPLYTVYIRVPAPRNGFVDPPDVCWNREKDEALWRILSRAPKNDIDWDDLAKKFGATVDFLLVQATILTERHVSQVRAQTRKVATLGTRESPAQSPARLGDQSPSTGVSASRIAASPAGLGQTPASEAMGRTLSGGGRALGGRASAETIRRTASTGSKSGPKVRSGAGTPSGGSRRPSLEDGQVRPSRLLRPSLETITSAIKADPASPSAGKTSAGTGQYSFATSGQQRRLQPSLPVRTARPANEADGTRRIHDTEEDEGEDDREDADAESPAALSSRSSSSSSSTTSEPVMSRIFRRPPGYGPQHQQQLKQQRPQQNQRDGLSSRPRGPLMPSGGGEGEVGGIGLGISSGGSDDGDESETQAAFLRFKRDAATAAAKGKAIAAGGHRHQRQQDAQSSPSSSSTSASPTARVFKTPTVAASAGNRTAAGNPSTASAVAAARLQSSRLPGMKSPPPLHHLHSAGRTTAAKTGVPGVSREGSETGTTPSIGSSFSDLDDVSFTQSVLDEALGSKVEDTVLTPNPHAESMSSSSAARRGR